jgi:hypothetical protein
VEFEAVGQHLGDDGGRRHRHGEAYRDAATPALVIGHRSRQSGAQRGEDHLRRAEAEHQAAHGLQALEAEFEADGEHQEDDAELGKAFHFRAFRQYGEAVGAHHDADRQVGQHGRHPETAHDRHRADGGGEQEQDHEQLAGAWGSMIPG